MVKRGAFTAFRLIIFSLASIATLTGQTVGQTGSESADFAGLTGQGETMTTGLTGLNPLGSHVGGLRLYNLTVYGGYYSGGAPIGFGALNTGSFLGSSGIAGASSTVGWVRSTERTRFAASYSASYMQQFSNSSMSGLNQSFGFQVSRQLGTRWNWNLVASAGVANAQQSLFSPTQWESVVSVPMSFDALSALAAGGNLSSVQIGSLLTGAPILASPAQTLLYGSRYFFTSAQTSVTYARSSRLSMTFSAGGTRTEHLQDKTRDAAYGYVLPLSTEMSAYVGVSYSLTPRTQATFSVAVMRSVSSLLDSYGTNGSVSITRNMGRHWFLRGSLGGGNLMVQRTAYSLPQGLQYTAGAGVGYRLFGSTLMASYQRFLGDPYGIGAQSTLDLSGAWNWSRPGSGWNLTASGGEQRLQVANLYTVNSWRATAAISRRLSRQMSFRVTYGFGNYSGYQGPLYNRTQKAVQASLVWTPNPAR